jgi:hypothetical protein
MRRFRNSILVSFILVMSTLATFVPLASADQKSDVAAALGISPSLVQSASFGTSDPRGYGISTSPASRFPTQSNSYLVLSSGCILHDPETNGCNLFGLDKDDGTRFPRDMAQLTLTLSVPSGAKYWLVDWRFFSDEFGSPFGSPDSFLIEVGSSTFTLDGSTIFAPNNVAFGPDGKPVTILTTGPLAMVPGSASGTTYLGATPALVTRAPVPENATEITLIFSVFDTVDDFLDSTVFIDNLRFSTVVIDGDDSGPITELLPLNSPPTASANGPYSGSEGGPIALVGNASDPDNDPLIHTWSYAAGLDVDAGASCTFSAPSSLDTTITCTDDGTYTVTLSVNDGTAPTVTSDATVTITNTKPTAAIIGPVAGSVFPIGTTIQFIGSYADAGANDSHTAFWRFGDTSTPPQAVSNGSVSTSHTFTTTGVFGVKLAVTDDDGGLAEATTVGGDDTNAYIVIYDPSAGFVTGGGWIASPAGAYTANPSLAGRANFGFVSKYRRGTSTPEGQTEFVFKAGDLHFHGNSYEWLVFSGPQAQYKGTGTINGVSGYTFMLTVTDGQANGGGGVDKFRIKIWNDIGVVFDNMLGASDGTGNGQAISGGNIMIHSR